MNPIIELQNIKFSYDTVESGEAPSYALKDVSLSIEEGSFVAILGHNGSGKSTLAKIMSLIQRPDEGSVRIFGKDVSSDSVSEDDINRARRDVGIVFQNPDNQIVATIVEEDVAFGVENLGLPSGEIRRRVDEALETVGMTKYARHAPHRLSGGQKQRVAIAGVIAMHRRAIIFDESTAMLDPMGRRDVMDTIERLNREDGVTVIMITHYMSEAVRADRVIVMREGGVFMDGSPKDVFSNPDMLKKAGLDVPQTTELLYLLKQKDRLNVKLDAFSPSECADTISETLNISESSGACAPSEAVAPSPDELTAHSGGKITFENVSYVYGKGTPYEIAALSGVNVTVEGGLTGIIGHTGSGKSTLVQLTNGLLKPTSGKIMLNGSDIWENPKKMRDVRFAVGLVMQYPEYQLFDETVFSDIAFGPKNMGLSKSEIEERVLESADFVGLDRALLAKSPFELSGGQKRRAALAGVLSMRPQILVLDEPAAGLDPAGRSEILTKIREYMKKSGTTVIIVSHSMEDMAIFCDRLIVMANGKVMMDSTPQEVFSAYNEMIAVGLDVPQITHTAAKLKLRGIDIGSDVYTVERAYERLHGIIRDGGKRA